MGPKGPDFHRWNYLHAYISFPLGRVALRGGIWGILGCGVLWMPPEMEKTCKMLNKIHLVVSIFHYLISPLGSVFYTFMDFPSWQNLWIILLASFLCNNNKNVYTCYRLLFSVESIFLISCHWMRCCSMAKYADLGILNRDFYTKFISSQIRYLFYVVLKIYDISFFFPCSCFWNFELPRNDSCTSWY